MTVSIDIDGIALLVTAYHYSIANQGRRFFLMCVSRGTDDMTAAGWIKAMY